ncbi:hypothetical protein BD310DRAFT_176858 [Dichomitus squalens]|uniref:Uncharacterized protein n=1 Tax=Dichomitus squalens TaxID=114155 RepID=A0A4Q9Q348_9APHY|nr:hypothetical protein BD310DRAFT_176858 [Dichomitus squalens]
MAPIRHIRRCSDLRENRSLVSASRNGGRGDGDGRTDGRAASVCPAQPDGTGLEGAEADLEPFACFAGPASLARIPRVLGFVRDRDCGTRSVGTAKERPRGRREEGDLKGADISGTRSVRRCVCTPYRRLPLPKAGGTHASCKCCRSPCLNREDEDGHNVRRSAAGPQFTR